MNSDIADSIDRLLGSRRSVRSFLDRPVEPEKLGRLVDAALAAPSGGNIQPFSIVAITDAGRRERRSW